MLREVEGTISYVGGSMIIMDSWARQICVCTKVGTPAWWDVARKYQHCEMVGNGVIVIGHVVRESPNQIYFDYDEDLVIKPGKVKHSKLNKRKNKKRR